MGNPYVVDDDDSLDITTRKQYLPPYSGIDPPNGQQAAKKRATKSPQEQVAAGTAVELPVGALTAHVQVNPPALEANRGLDASDRTDRDASIFMGRLRDIFPDICLNHVKRLFEQQKYRLSGQLDMTDIVQQVADELLEIGTYPRVESRKRREPEKEGVDLTSDQVAKLRANGTYNYYAYVTTFSLNGY